jgi:predicted transglutaminase-like cysteine proteinase
MKKLVMAVATATIFGLMFTPGAAEAGSGRTAGQDTHKVSMREFGQARPPFGFVSFCERYPADCNATSGGARVAELTLARWAQLVEINTRVNASIAPVTDLDLYKKAEYWDYPENKGDCEDYVLAKRRMLMERGWPASSLLITVVRDEDNLGHAILTVATDHGDFILDNKNSGISYWQDTPYSFQKRQSQHDPLQWVSLSPAEGLRLEPADPVAAR